MLVTRVWILNLLKPAQVSKSGGLRGAARCLQRRGFVEPPAGRPRFDHQGREESGRKQKVVHHHDLVLRRLGANLENPRANGPSGFPI